MTKAVLEAALASRNAALDRRTLAQSKQSSAPDSARRAAAARESASVARDDSLRAAAVVAADDSAGMTPIVAVLPLRAPSAPKSLPARAVPDVRGLTLRAAVMALHSAGFRVAFSDGPYGTTMPAAGVLAPAGTLIQLGGRP